MKAQCKDCIELQTLKNVNESHVAMLKLKHDEVNSLEQTIKGLDRRTREYQEEVDKLKRMINDANERWASIPTRNDNDMIKIRDRIIKEKNAEINNLNQQVSNQRDTIAQYRTEMLQLQRKVDEQDRRLHGQQSKRSDCQQSERSTVKTGCEVVDFIHGVMSGEITGDGVMCGAFEQTK